MATYILFASHFLPRIQLHTAVKDHADALGLSYRSTCIKGDEPSWGPNCHLSEEALRDHNTANRCIVRVAARDSERAQKLCDSLEALRYDRHYDRHMDVLCGAEVHQLHFSGLDVATVLPRNASHARRLGLAQEAIDIDLDGHGGCD